MGIIYDQATGGEQLTTNGKLLRTLVTKGSYEDQFAAANARPRGTAIPGYGYVLSWNLNRVAGNNGICTYQLVSMTQELWLNNAPMSETWNLKHIRVDVPIERYGGPSEGNSANLYDLARWQTEPDRALYVAYKYRTENNVLVSLSNPTILLAKKLEYGHQVVQRHFPVAVRTRLYARVPYAVGEDLDRIYAPEFFASAAKDWLKIQDDLDQGGDGNWQRVEAWQGAESWDVNFYGSGTQRWEFGAI